MQNIVGYLATGLIGISLGLIGGGGSIITIPVLVYLFHIEPTLATLYSLFIVGTTSLVGGIRSAINKTVDFRSAVCCALDAGSLFYTPLLAPPHSGYTLHSSFLLDDQEYRHHDILLHCHVIRFVPYDTRKAKYLC